MYLPIYGLDSDNHPSKYQPRTHVVLLNFSDQMRKDEITPYKQTVVFFFLFWHVIIF